MARPVARGDLVRHKSTDMIGAHRGHVLGVFTDSKLQLYAAVEWKGHALSLTRTYLLERIGSLATEPVPVPNIQA